MRNLALTLLVLLSVALAAGCSSGEKTTSAPAGRTIAVQLGEYTLTAGSQSVASGSITFNVKNNGLLEHEFMVIKTDLAPNALVVSGSMVDEAASGTTIGTMIDTKSLQPSKSASATYDLAPGKYVLICNVATHYQLGMHAALTVQ